MRVSVLRWQTSAQILPISLSGVTGRRGVGGECKNELNPNQQRKSGSERTEDRRHHQVPRC